MAQSPPGGQPPGPPGYPPPPPAGGYPPPPAGGGYPAAPAAGGYPAADPYAADRALAEWAQARGYTLGTTPDVAWYQGWYPFVYVFRLARLGREVRATFGDASLFLAEAFEADEIKRAAGEDRQLLALIASPRLAARAAIRSKTGGGLVNEVKTGLGSLFSSSSAGAALGDPTFEGRFDVTVPSREEGNRALPMGLRQFLLQSNWKGVLETRAGGLAVVPYDRRSFDPGTLDTLINNVGQLYQLLTG